MRRRTISSRTGSCSVMAAFIASCPIYPVSTPIIKSFSTRGSFNPLRVLVIGYPQPPGPPSPSVKLEPRYAARIAYGTEAYSRLPEVRLSPPRPVLRVEPVAEAVGHHVEAEHRDHDGEAGEDDHPGRLEHEPAAVGEHQAEGWRRRAHPDPHERERGFHQDGDGHEHGGLDQDRGGGVRQDVAQHEAGDGGAEGAGAIHVDFH